MGKGRPKPEPHPEGRPYRTPWERMCLETWTVLMEHAPLVPMAGIILVLDYLRRSLAQAEHSSLVWERAVLIAEVMSFITLLGPKLVRSLGELLQTIAVTWHAVAYSFRHGSRPPAPGTEGPDPKGRQP